MTDLPLDHRLCRSGRCTIRRASYRDLDTLVPLAAALRKSRGQLDHEPAMVRAQLERWLLAWGSRLIVVEVAGQTVGYCAYDACAARLLEIFVAEPYRGQGLGCELILFAEQDLLRSEVELLRVEVGPDGEPARAFFAHLGYQPAAGAASCVALQKAL
jgi:ribosomal protein S18 acetylase RimI-like enzyme